MKKLQRDENLKKYSPLLQKLLSNRGIKTNKEAEIFLNPDYEKGTHSPFLLKDMEKASERIRKAIKTGEKICIFSDYDADGIPGAVILHDFFQKISFENFFNYIPDREKEGFGLNKKAIEKINNKNTSLIITIDCGISGKEEVALAHKLGIDTIITDHHLPNGKAPEAYAIINPKQKGDKYPFKDLCGAALSYKLVQALLADNSFEVMPGWEKWLLDMVCIATISDMVPLVGENRVLSYFGLKVLKKSRRPGLKTLLEKSRIKRQDITEDDIGFVIAPRINAASRMDKPIIAFKALASKNLPEAIEAVKKLEKINNERKGLVASMVKEVKRRLPKVDESKNVIVIGNSKWKPGMLGLVANKIAEEYDKPTYVWGRGESPTIKGSFRSNQKIDTFNLSNSLPRDFFITLGGHTFAGGFEIEHNKIFSLEEELEKAFQTRDYSVSGKEQKNEEELGIDDISRSLYQEIIKLRPFGLGNPKPIFLLQNIILGKVEAFGKEKLHTKLVFSKSNNQPIESVSFFRTPESFGVPLAQGKKVNLLASMEENNFMGARDIRLRIVEVF